MDKLVLDVDPKDRIKFCTTLPARLIQNLCRKNTKINDLLCHNENYWKELHLRNYLYPNKEPVSWKELCLFSPRPNNSYYFTYNYTQERSYRFSTLKTIKDFCILSSSSSTYHSLLIDHNHDVWVTGSNKYGQLGLGKEEVYPYYMKRDFIKLPNIKAKQVSAGSRYSMILDMNNNIWVFGDNTKGQLGTGFYTNEYTPYKLPDLKATQIAAGTNHSLFIECVTNNVWGMGCPISGRLGPTTHTPWRTPAPIQNTKAKQIAAGDYTLIIDMNDIVWCYGYPKLCNAPWSNHGLAKRYNTNIKGKQISCNGRYHMIIDLEDNVWGFGTDMHNYYYSQNVIKYEIPPTKIPNIKAKQISAGHKCSMIIDLEGNVWKYGIKYGSKNKSDNKPYYSHLPTKIPNSQASFISVGHLNIIIKSHGITPFEDIYRMEQEGKIATCEIDPILQLSHIAPNKVLKLYSLDGQQYYVYGDYNFDTKKLFLPELLTLL